MKFETEQVFKVLFFLSCLGVVLWQCGRCTTKYLSKPKGTQMSIISVANNSMFPFITICPYPNTNTVKSHGTKTLLEHDFEAGPKYFKTDSFIQFLYF